MQWIWASQQIGWDLYSFTYRVRRSEVKLFTDIQEYYNRVQATDRLPKLLPTMLRDEDKGKAKAPKLRAKAGEARALVPCALELARKYLDPVISQEEAMLHAAEDLNSMCTCLSSAAWDQAVFKDAAQRYLLLAGQLEAFFEEDKIFRGKPKAHQLVELAGMMSILVGSGHIGTRAMDTPWRSWVGDEEANLACVLFLAKS